MDNEIFKKILTARVYDVASRTPLEKAEKISAKLNNTILLKREDLQPVHSFKIRGAYNKIFHLSDTEKSAGIICASAGNHAQGVALSCQKLGINATIVMPQTTPKIKTQSVRAYGACVILEGDSYSDAAEHCNTLVSETGATFIHPFDDPSVIAGQGTIGYEILQQCSNPDYIFIPVGGGGLLAGVASYIKELYPDIKIIGVEPADSNVMINSIRQNKLITLDRVGIFADGVAVKRAGEITFRICSEYADDWVEVNTDEICSAIQNIYEDTRSIVEPAGALAIAGIKQYVESNGIKEKQIVSINSGANINFDRLRFVAERTLIGENREAIFAISIPEKPGSLKLLCENILGEKSITEFNYRFMSREVAHIFISVLINDHNEKNTFSQSLTRHGFEHWNLTDNELAKVHIRYMVGGRTKEAKNEVLYRFSFPERPGALRDFLSHMSENWNISLFHYRAQGGNFGRVLIGFEIPQEDRENFKNVMDNCGYPFIDETDNMAYKLFL